MTNVSAANIETAVIINKRTGDSPLILCSGADLDVQQRIECNIGRIFPGLCEQL
ncbi:MAG: hypothetical protein AAB209_02945 [Bacteroidota bacterium]